jgi:uncharacterized protein with HEPN domain
MKAGSRDCRDFFEDMDQYAEKGMRIVKDLDYDAFQSNEEKVLAAIRVIEVIVEAAKNIPPSIRDRYPDVPWSGLARMRDKLIHVSFGVDIESMLFKRIFMINDVPLCPPISQKYWQLTITLRG